MGLTAYETNGPNIFATEIVKNQKAPKPFFVQLLEKRQKSKSYNK